LNSFVFLRSFAAARSRGSITMRMLMGANEIYADGKAKPMTANGNILFERFQCGQIKFDLEFANEQSNKRAVSPPQDKAQSLEYLIRGELIRACPTLPKSDGERIVCFEFSFIFSWC